MKRHYLLDLVRGLGAIAVVHFHSGVLWNVMPYGYLAVDLFFGLSGYVMAMTYEQRLKDGMRLWPFLRARLARLYPVYLIGIALGLAVIAAKAAAGREVPTLWAIPLNAMMLPAPASGDFFPVDVPDWSLFFELIAYLLFGLLIARTSDGALVAIVIAAVFVLHGRIPNAGSSWADFPIGLARLGLAFPIGVLLWRCGWQPPALPAMLLPLATFLGDVSYPLYIIHYPLLSPWEMICRKLDVHGPAPALLFTAIAVAIAALISRRNVRNDQIHKRGPGLSTR